MDKECEKIYDQLINTKYRFDDYFKVTYILPDQYNKITILLSKFRKMKCMDIDDLSIIIKLFKIHSLNYFKLKEKRYQIPRILAQRFISKKNIRNFIFKRDDYKCLSCGSKLNLAIDHINPVNKGGENKIGNLQTLCRICNSKKSDNYNDFR